ncbi:MAG TPA: ATP-binding protein [Verrucomicrobiae bacterium]|nr:ATP-binding protein [Verrucomicrobiae bacterium]
MPKPTLIIITGLPGAGKTTLAKKLAPVLKLPLLTKDSIKEIIFDTLGWSDREWSKKVGLASYTIMNSLIETELAAGRSLLLESNFKPEFDNPRFQAWQQKYKFISLQIFCTAEGEVLFERFKRRVSTGERHPGHVDGANHDEFKDILLHGAVEPLSLKGNVITLNTTDFATVNMTDILKQVRKNLQN